MELRSEVIHVRVSEEMKRVLEEKAVMEKVSVGELIRVAIEEWLRGGVGDDSAAMGRELEEFCALVWGMKKRDCSWAEISQEVYERYGVKLDKGQLKSLNRGW